MTSTAAPATTDPVARPEDRFPLGLRRVGRTAADPYGEPTRPPLDPALSARRLAVPTGFAELDVERAAVRGQAVAGLDLRTVEHLLGSQHSS
jgi:hypothetical protein